MFDCVPDPVCHITKGNSASCFPLIISSQTREINADFSGVKTPKSQFACAAAFFRYAKA